MRGTERQHSRTTVRLAEFHSLASDAISLVPHGRVPHLTVPTSLIHALIHPQIPLPMTPFHPIMHLSPIPTGMQSPYPRGGCIPTSQFHTHVPRF
jgi:hypothetical protein